MHRSAVVHSAAIVAAGARPGSAECARCSAAHPPPPPAMPLLLALPLPLLPLLPLLLPMLSLALPMLPLPVLVLLGLAPPLALPVRNTSVADTGAANAAAEMATGDTVRGGSSGGDAETPLASDIGAAAAETDSETEARCDAGALVPPLVLLVLPVGMADATDACGEADENDAAAPMLLVEKRRRKVETAAALPGVENERAGSRSADSATLEPTVNQNIRKAGPYEVFSIFLSARRSGK